MSWLIFFGIAVLICCIPVGASVRYDSDGFVLRIIAGFIRYTVIPLKRKKKKSAPKEAAKPAAEAKQPAQKTASNTQQKTSEKRGGSWKDFLPLVKVGLDFLNSFRKKIRVNYISLKLMLAGDDPCDLAVNYGRAWVAIDQLTSQLERVSIVKKHDFDVCCDFTAEEILATFQMDVTITVGRILWLAVKYGFLMIKEFLKMKRIRKGGAVA